MTCTYPKTKKKVKTVCGKPVRFRIRQSGCCCESSIELEYVCSDRHYDLVPEGFPRYVTDLEDYFNKKLEEIP